MSDEKTKHTPGPWEVAVWDEAKDPVEQFREQISYGSGPIWGVWCPEHPLTRGKHPNPEHAVMPALTGNGPASEANAYLVSAAPDLLAALKMLAHVVGEQPASDVDDGSIYALAVAHSAIAKAEGKS